MYKRLCKAADRENFRLLTNKTGPFLKTHKHELRELNDKNMIQMFLYTLMSLYGFEMKILLKQNKNGREHVRTKCHVRIIMHTKSRNLPEWTHFPMNPMDSMYCNSQLASTNQNINYASNNQRNWRCARLKSSGSRRIVELIDEMNPNTPIWILRLKDSHLLMYTTRVHLGMSTCVKKPRRFPIRTRTACAVVLIRLDYSSKLQITRNIINKLLFGVHLIILSFSHVPTPRRTGIRKQSHQCTRLVTFNIPRNNTKHWDGTLR
jgi:hypothetical protein